MGGALAGSAARIAGGIGMVACAAVVAFAVGGGGVFGGLGSLFGRSGATLDVARAHSPAADIVAAPTAAQRRGSGQATIPGSTKPRTRPRGRARHAPARPQRPAGGSPSPLQPAPIQPPPLPPATPSPGPGGGQAVATVGETVKQVAGQAPPQLQPLTKPVSDAVDGVVETCRGLPVCP